MKKSKTNLEDMAPVNLRITVNLERFEISTKVKVNIYQWDSRRQRIKGKSENALSINNYLEDLKNKVWKEFNLLNENEATITASELKNALRGNKKNKKRLLDVFEENNKLMQKEVGLNYTPNTMERYKISKTRLAAFLEQDISGIDISLDQLDYKFMKRYENFLRTNYLCGHNTVMKYLKHLKKVIHQAMTFGYIEHDPFLGYKTAYKESNRGYLSQNEVDRLKTKIFRIPRLNETRDIFLFVCYTGISYSDLKELSQNNIQFGIDGQRIIVLERKKTRVRAVIPILPEAQEILDKYASHPVCIANNTLLPVISNQKLNAYLQEIAELCEINKVLTMHLGRHTFATTITLSNGVPLETVQKMLGHKNISTTLVYSKVVDSKVAQDMKILEEKLKIS